MKKELTMREMIDVKIDDLFPGWQDAGNETTKAFSHPHASTPKLNPYYWFPEQATLELISILQKPIRNNVFMTGPTGSGKTSLVRNLAAKLNTALWEINANYEMTPSQIIGTWRSKKGDMHFAEGVITKWMRHGGILLINEYTTFDPACPNALKSVLDEPRRLCLTQNDDELIEGHPDCRIVVTDNTRGRGDDSGMYVNTEVQSIADLRRFHATIIVDYIPEADEVAMLHRMFPQLCQNDDKTTYAIREPAKVIEVLKKFVDVANKTRTAFKQGKTSRVLSTAEVITWVENYSTLFATVHHAAKVSFLNSYEDEARPAVREMINNVFGQEDAEIIGNTEAAARASETAPDSEA